MIAHGSALVYKYDCCAAAAAVMTLVLSLRPNATPAGDRHGSLSSITPI